MSHINSRDLAFVAFAAGAVLRSRNSRFLGARLNEAEWARLAELGRIVDWASRCKYIGAIFVGGASVGLALGIIAIVLLTMAMLLAPEFISALLNGPHRSMTIVSAFVLATALFVLLIVVATRQVFVFAPSMAMRAKLLTQPGDTAIVAAIRRRNRMIGLSLAVIALVMAVLAVVSRQ